MDMPFEIWEHRLDVIDAWLTSYRMPPQTFISTFRDIKKEFGFKYPSQVLWRGFSVFVDSEEKMRTYSSPDVPIFVQGSKACQSWSRSRNGSIAWMKLNYGVKPAKQEDIENGQGYVFLVTAEIKGSEILLDVQNDLRSVVDPSRFENQHLFDMAQDAYRQVTKTFVKEKEMIVLSQRKEIPTLSIEVFKIARVK